MTADIPPYFDYLIEGFQQGRSSRFVHLGHWDTPPDPGTRMNEDEFQQAQSSLNEYLLGMADLQNGLSVLDVGCGFGGTIDCINKQYEDMQLFGINIDSRQLDICQQLIPENNNLLEWKQADACQLPFPDNSFDRILCIEAMFHFSSRRKFVKEVARILRPGGNLVASDMLVQPSASQSIPSEYSVESAIQQGFGPWPDFWSEDADHEVLATDSSLSCNAIIDATINTLPSYNFTVSDDVNLNLNSCNDAQRAGFTLKWLHQQGHLKYLYLRMDKH